MSRAEWQREFVDMLHSEETLPTATPLIRVSRGPNLTPGAEPSGEALPREFDPHHYSRLELGPYKPHRT